LTERSALQLSQFSRWDSWFSRSGKQQIS